MNISAQFNQWRSKKIRSFAPSQIFGSFLRVIFSDSDLKISLEIGICGLQWISLSPHYHYPAWLLAARARAPSDKIIVGYKKGSAAPDLHFVAGVVWSYDHPTADLSLGFVWVSYHRERTETPSRHVTNTDLWPRDQHWLSSGSPGPRHSGADPAARQLEQDTRHHHHNIPNKDCYFMPF